MGINNIILFLSAAVVPAALAAEPGAGIRLELNRVEQVEASCRLTFTVENGAGAGLEALVYETVLFDTGGGVAKLSLFDFREVPEGALRVRQFDLAETQCETLGGVLVNGVAACRVGGAEAGTCAAATTLTSRTRIEVLQ